MFYSGISPRTTSGIFSEVLVRVYFRHLRSFLLSLIHPRIPSGISSRFFPGILLEVSFGIHGFDSFRNIFGSFTWNCLRVFFWDYLLGLLLEFFYCFIPRSPWLLSEYFSEFSSGICFSNSLRNSSFISPGISLQGYLLVFFQGFLSELFHGFLLGIFFRVPFRILSKISPDILSGFFQGFLLQCLQGGFLRDIHPEIPFLIPARAS